jgi:hypothetical protein
MRYFIYLFLGMLTTAALAAEPSYTCAPDQGCIEEPGLTHDVGRGAKITLPDGWTYYSYPTAPNPAMAGLREIRAFKDGMVIAISPFPNIDHREITEDWIRDIERKSVAKYVSQSKEKLIDIVSISKDALVGCYSSFTAMNDDEKPFAVLPNRRHSSVTSFVISYKFIIFSVSVVSERSPDKGYLAAVDAIRNIQ